jgi:hypothetical protein
MFFKSHGHADRPTNAEQLRLLLSDGQWHSTKELSRRIGHTFGFSIWKLRHEEHRDIERRAHPSCRYQHQYRLVPPRLQTIRTPSGG